MPVELDAWRLAAGLGLFLFGMHHLEQALQQLAGRPFKVFLRDHTSRPVQGVLAGALATAALQSSSVVSLLVMALVGTGIISLASAIGIVFGSNLGTTATGWIVATVGFKLDIEALALPLVAAGGLGVVWSAVGSRRLAVSRFAISFGLMFLGLDFMKTSAESVTMLFDPGSLARFPLFVFLIAGILVTAVIQSSSATIMLTLSALYASAISLPSAAAIAIGANVGTTITAVLAASAGSAAKKRVAAATVIFNLVTAFATFIALSPLLNLITAVAGITDPLFSLVAFHSLFNFIGIILFMPFVGVLSRWLETRFAGESKALLRYINKSDAAVPEAAIENLSRETYRLIDQAAALNQVSLGLRPDRTFYASDEDRRGVRIFDRGFVHDECYAELKLLEGRILAFVLALQAQPFRPVVSARLSRIAASIRNAVHAAKTMRDTHHDMQRFRDSANDQVNGYFEQFRSMAREFYDTFDGLKHATSTEQKKEILRELDRKNDALHESMHANIYRDVMRGQLSETEISTMLNVNREMLVSGQNLIEALSDALPGPIESMEIQATPTAS